jgi:diguanylate cyclase (GGDEF)-like protein
MHPPAHTIDIKDLHLEFNFRVQQKLHEVQELLLQFSQNQNADDILLQLHSIFLALGNTSKSLGLDIHSKLANDMGSLTSNLLVRNESPEPVVDKMVDLLNQMMRISNDNQTNNSSITTTNNAVNPLIAAKQNQHQIIDVEITERPSEVLAAPLIILQMTAGSDTLELIRRFQQQGYQTQRFTDFDHIIDQLSSQMPSGILLDLDIIPEQPSGQLLDLLDNLRKQHCSIGFLSSYDHFNVRLKAVRLHGNAFFVKPADIQAINKSFHGLLLNRTSNPSRILIIEPRRQQSHQLKQHCLKMCRCEVIEVNSYYESLTRAIEFKPDFAIIATDQDGAHGKDVAAILKQYESLMHLHCLFVSSNKSDALASKIMHGDTPILHYDHPNFLNELLLNLEQIIPQQRYLHDQLFFDTLTGVLLKTKFLEQLEGMVSAAKRYGSLLNCAIIDIDHLNQVNRQYGFWVGDRVIRQLANMLTKRLRRSDLIARVGANRFAVIMPNTTLNNACKVIGTLKDNFGLLPNTTLGNTFYCSFSAGISSFPQFENVTELLTHAEHNLIAAKTSGRNRINREY